MSKLIRDRLPAFLKREKATLVYKKAPESQRELLLFEKMMEEACEWLRATDDDQWLKELGDMQEVLWAMADAHGISEIEVIEQANAKRKARGGFTELQILDVELESDKSGKFGIKVTEERFPPSVPDSAYTACYSG